jgi:hypothetical protein
MTGKLLREIFPNMPPTISVAAEPIIHYLVAHKMRASHEDRHGVGLDDRRSARHRVSEKHAERALLKAIRDVHNWDTSTPEHLDERINMVNDSDHRFLEASRKATPSDE